METAGEPRENGEEAMKETAAVRRKRWARAAAAWMLTVLLMGMTGLGWAETKLMVVSDLHYLAPSLYRGSETFLQVLRKGDGKITQYGEELLAALYRQIMLERPDALIVTGDLSFNGEKESHAALADWFKAVEAAGVPVWVIPGNHDINAPFPVGFGNGLYYGVEAVTPEEFETLYADFMEPGEAGFSYVARISDDLWVAMTDVAWYQEQGETFGVFTAPHAAWLESVLRRASETGVRVVTATHHSLLSHTDFSPESYLMFGNESMAALAKQYGVHLNLSGHLHIQHIVRDGALADAALGAFCMWPHRYAVVALSENKGLQYAAKALDEALLPDGFPQISREWFAGIAREKIKAGLTGTDEEIEQMADYAAQFNLAYFSGTYRTDDPFWTDDPAYSLWKKQEASGFWQYLQLVMHEPSGDHLFWEER